MSGEWVVIALVPHTHIELKRADSRWFDLKTLGRRGGGNLRLSDMGSFPPEYVLFSHEAS